MIEGVKIRALVRHLDERGYLMEILRDDDEEFVKFGQVYLTTCNPGIVKAWHCHEKQTDNLCLVKGAAKVGLWDGHRSQTVILSELEPKLLQVPPGIWHGFTALGGDPCYILNIPTEHYERENPDELRKDPFDPEIEYQWEPQSR